MADVVQRARTFTEDSVRPGSAWRAEALSLIIELADEVEKLANVIIDGAVAGYKREIETERTTTVNYYVRAYDPMEDMEHWHGPLSKLSAVEKAQDLEGKWMTRI
jgi:hypothetical protein